MSGGADVTTPTAMVFLQDRPIVPLSAALANALAEGEETNRALQIVTSPYGRITLPLRTSKAQWIVHSDGYYEGLTGRPMRWDGNAFTPDPDARDYAPTYTTPPSEPIGSQLVLTFQAAPSEPQGAQVEHLMRLLTGHPPTGWGATEPVQHAWPPSDRGIRVIAVGEHTIAMTRLSNGTEMTTLSTGYTPEEEPPISDLPSMISEIAAEASITSLLAQLNPGRADLTTEPRWTGASAPIGLAVSGTFTGAPGFTRRRLGPLTWFPLGDGRSPEYWQRHQDLLSHLRDEPGPGAAAGSGRA